MFAQAHDMQADMEAKIRQLERQVSSSLSQTDLTNILEKTKGPLVCRPLPSENHVPLKWATVRVHHLQQFVFAMLIRCLAEGIQQICGRFPILEASSLLG